MKDIFLIMNPASHSGRSRQAFDKIMDLIKQSGQDYDFKITQDLKDAEHISRYANQEGYKTIVAVGGDGTINAVINGFFDSSGYRLSKAVFGVIYTGTSPDFNKSYHIPVDVETATKVILKSKVTSIPVGMITFENTDNPVRFFVCCANIGLGAKLARMANNGIRKKLGDFLGTMLSLIRLLIRYQYFDLNQDEIQSGKIVNLSIGLTPYIASGIRMPVVFTNSKREFYRVMVRDITLGRIIPLLYKIYSGKVFKNRTYLNLDYTPGIRISSPTQIEVEADGDPVGFLPCRFSFTKEDLNVLTN